EMAGGERDGAGRRLDPRRPAAPIDPWAAGLVGGQLEDLKQQALSEFSALALETLTRELPSALGRAAGPLFEKLEKKWADAIKRVQNQLDEQGGRLTNVEGHTRVLEQRLAHLEKELDLARARPREVPVVSFDWDRAVDHSILVVRSPDMVPKAGVQEALTEWLKDANFAFGKEAELVGDDMGKQFTVAFLGPMQATRESRRRQAQGALRFPTGRWRDFAVTVGGRRSPIFVSVDKNRKEVATEMACKKLRKVEWNQAALGDLGLGHQQVIDLARKTFV
ncbi:unnamed protein product, partial [Prorocentrum cordatum]